MSEELCNLTISDAARLLKSRKLSPVQLTDAYLARIETFQPQLDAFVAVTADLARKQAKRAEREIARGDYRGPLHGVPFGLKDIYAT